jgi:phosphate transport system protein
VRSSFHQELEELQQDILRMGTLVEERIGQSVRSLESGDMQTAQEIVDGDDDVDAMQVDIETRCLEIIALQQPMASDLRIVGTAIKIVGDLERIGDHAVDIAKVTLRIAGEPLMKPLIDIPRMADLAQRMTRDALRAYVRRDPDAAHELLRTDDQVDHLYSQVLRELLVYMMEDPRTIHQATHLLFVAQHLERVADHATNLGEAVIYMVSGERKDLNH